MKHGLDGFVSELWPEWFGWGMGHGLNGLGMSYCLGGLGYELLSEWFGV